MYKISCKLLFIMLISAMLYTNLQASNLTQENVILDANYKNDTIRLSLKIVSTSLSSYFFQLTYWEPIGFQAKYPLQRECQPYISNEPLLYNYIYLNTRCTFESIDAYYDFKELKELPYIITYYSKKYLTEEELLDTLNESKLLDTLTINFIYDNKQKDIVFESDSVEFSINLCYATYDDMSHLRQLDGSEIFNYYEAYENEFYIELFRKKFEYIKLKEKKKINKNQSNLLYAFFNKYIEVKKKIKIK